MTHILYIPIKLIKKINIVKYKEIIWIRFFLKKIVKHKQELRVRQTHIKMLNLEELKFFVWLIKMTQKFNLRRIISKKLFLGFNKNLCL